ncbi:MAG: glycosyltransferase [bacterium]|nr:glycosyltransferase [bacterium]
MTLLIAIITLLYILLALFIRVGLSFRQKFVRGTQTLRGSLVICGRDEGKDLPACLQSIEDQTISTDLLEVILVDDCSNDSTGALMDNYAARSRYQVQVLHMLALLPGEPGGKWRPLKEGIKLAQYEALLLSDADAILTPTWAERHLLELESAEAAAGFAIIEGEGLWSKVQALDWLFLLGVGSSLSRWGMPQAALGKNLSVRRSAYESVGGLEGIGFSLTEDRALVQALARRGARVSFPISPEMAVITPGVSTWSKFTQQRLRWATGIRWLNPVGKLCVFTMALRHYLILLGIILGCPAAWTAWVLTSLFDYALQRHIASKLEWKELLRYFVLWELFYTCSAPYLGYLTLTRRRVQWKGRKFD